MRGRKPPAALHKGSTMREVKEVKEVKATKVDNGLAAKVRVLEEAVKGMKANWKAFCVKHVGDDDDGKIGSAMNTLLSVMAIVAIAGFAFAGVIENWDENGGNATLTESGGTITLDIDAITPVTVASSGAISGTTITGSGAVSSTSSADGASTRLIARASFGATDYAVGTNSLGIIIPSNAVVVGGYIDVTSELLSSNMNRKIGFELNGSEDMYATVSNTFLSAGLNALVPVWTAASAVKMTAARTLVAVIEDYPLTNGTATVVIEYDLLAR